MPMKEGIKKESYTPYQMSDILERMISMNQTTTPIDYGTGEKFNPVEVHILSYIADNPGISASEIARDWNRTKGAVSQIVKKLSSRGMIRRCKKEGNDKTVCLYMTEEGQKLDLAHRAYDTRNYERFLKLMEKQFSKEVINEAFHVMNVWIELSKNWVPY